MFKSWKTQVMWEKDSSGADSQAEPTKVVEEPTTTEPITEPDSNKEQTKPIPDYRDKIIGRLTSKKNSLAEENAQLKRQLDEAKTNKQPILDTTPNPTSTVNIDELASAKAAAIILNSRADEEAERGRELFPDFKEKVNALSGVVDLKDPQGQATYAKFLEIALETGKAAEIVYALGSDLEEADRVLSLSPVKMAIAVAKLITKEVDNKKPNNIESLPKPITPIGNRKGPHSGIDPDTPDADKLETAEWMRRRQAQVDEKNKARSRR